MHLHDHSRGLHSLVVAVVLLASLLVPCRPAAAATERESGCAAVQALDGTFLQLTRAAALRPRAEWEGLFTDMARVGVAQVFVQWTTADGVAFYAEDPPRPDDVPVLGLLLELAERHGMRLWLGLAHDAGWWAGIDRARPATDVEVFLARRRLAHLAVARALAPQVAGRPVFAGWYVPDEIDDKNWLGAARGALVAGYLRDLGTELAAAAPGAGLAVSGFAQGWATPQQVVDLWTAIVARAPLTLVLFQDGIGAGKLTLDEEAIYLPLLRRAMDEHGKQLGIVVELFAPATPAAGGTAASGAVPAPLGRIEAQLALAKRYASGPVVAFSLPDYMSGFGGAAAARLYDDYRRWAERCGVRTPAR